MKSKFLMAVAAIAIVASGVVAKAQEAPKHDERPGAQRVEPKAEPPRAAQAERRDEPMKGEAVAPKAADTERTAPRQGAEPPRAAQTEERNRPVQQGQTGTMQREPKRTAEPNGARPAARTGENENARKAPQTAGRQPRVIGKAGVSQEHAARVGELLQRNARPERVDFGIDVGARVPETVVLYPLPAEVLAFAPEYQGDDYFIDSDDEIVFVSPETHEIVGAIEYEGRAAAEDSATHVAGARPCPIEN